MKNLYYLLSTKLFFYYGRDIFGESSIKMSNVSYERKNFYEFLTEK